MTDTTETTLWAKLRLHRGLTIKLVSVGLFAALGTFAVVQSILGEKDASNAAEQEAVTENASPVEALQGLLAPTEALSAHNSAETESSPAAIPAALIKTSVAAGTALPPASSPATSGGTGLPELNLVGAERKGAATHSGTPTSAAKPMVPELPNPNRSIPVTTAAGRPDANPEGKSESGTEFRFSSGNGETAPKTPVMGSKEDSTNRAAQTNPPKPQLTPPNFPDEPNREKAVAASQPEAVGMPVANSFSLGDHQAANAQTGNPNSTGPLGASPPTNSLRSPNPSLTSMSAPAEPSGGASPAKGQGAPPAAGPTDAGPANRNPSNASAANTTAPQPPQAPPASQPAFGGAASFGGTGTPLGSNVSASNSARSSASTGDLPNPLPNSLAVPGSGGTPTSGVVGAGRPADLPSNPNSTPPGSSNAASFPPNPGGSSGPMSIPGSSPPAVNFNAPPPAGQSASGLGTPTPVPIQSGTIPSGPISPGIGQGGFPGQNLPGESPRAEGGAAAAAASAIQRPAMGPSSFPNGSPSSTGLGVNANLARNSAATAGVAPALGAGTPGKPELEGEQIPALSIEKVAPREIQIDQPTEFRIVVKNVGRVVANEVRVTDQVPRGAEFVKAVPEATRSSGGGLLWELGSLKPGEERTVVLTLQPKQTGEIGSVAQVTFATPASMRVLVTKPQLAVEHSGPAKVMIGDRVPLTIQVRNLGNGPAREVILQEAVPPQLKFAEDFQDLEYEIGTLAPGESRKVTLNLSAAQIGRFRNTILVSGAGGLHAEHQLDMEVVAPQLQLSSEGPNRRFLKRNATHVFAVRNAGTAIATNLDLVTKLPRGVRFVSANNQGQYDPGSHAVYWSLDRLNVGQAASVQLTTTPEEPGEQELEFLASADLNQKASFRQPLLVEDLMELFFEIDDIEDVIEVGSETRYRLRLTNQGTVTATNIQLVFSAEQGIRPVSVDNRLAAEVRGQDVIFAPVAQIRPGEEIVTLITAVGAAPGEHRVVARLRADQREMNVSKEESTRVYADR